MSLLLLLVACGSNQDDTGKEAEVEALVLPDDASARGVPVGMRTVSYEGQTFEVWYPTTDAYASTATDSVDIEPFIPTSFTDAVGAVDLPAIDSQAVRDAPVRDAGEPYPVVLFSHGFGGLRYQSMDYTSHLASRGYVVIAPDHPGRMLGDVLPCMFSPALEGCDLSSMYGDDPAVDDLAAARAWVEAGGEFLAGYIDPERIALSGHSAGAGSTAGVGADGTYDALLLMAGGASTTSPSLFMDGSCDAYATEESIFAAAAASTDADAISIQGAGHLAFSDLCQLELGTLANEVLIGRDDVNTLLLEQLLDLATSGCPDGNPPADRAECANGFLDLSVSAPIVRYYSTVFFDQQLYGKGSGVTGGVYPEVVMP